MNKLLVLTRDQDEFEMTLRQMELPELELLVPRSDEELRAALTEANIALANPPMFFSHVNQARRLVWMQSTFAGVDALIQNDLRRDYALTNVKDTYGEAMAEYVFTYIFLFEREVLENIEWQRQRQWMQKGYQTLSGKTLGIMGTGSIGKAIARVAKVFGMKTLGFRASDEAVPPFDEIFTRETIEEFLSQSDYVISVLPHTKDTVHLINHEVFRAMKPSAVFMSLGRGSNVHEGDLISALTSGQIKAAVLDVFEKEPLPTDHPLWSLPNVFVTPHVSGYTLSKRIFEIFRENYLRFIEGRELLYRIDFEKGY